MLFQLVVVLAYVTMFFRLAKPLVFLLDVCDNAVIVISGMAWA